MSIVLHNQLPLQIMNNGTSRPQILKLTTNLCRVVIMTRDLAIIPRLNIHGSDFQIFSKTCSTNSSKDRTNLNLQHEPYHNIKHSISIPSLNHIHEQASIITSTANHNSFSHFFFGLNIPHDHPNTEHAVVTLLTHIQIATSSLLASYTFQIPPNPDNLGY